MQMAVLETCHDLLAASVHKNGWLGLLLSQRIAVSVFGNGYLGQTKALLEIGCLNLVDWLADPVYGCQIYVWMQAPLAEYHTVCSLLAGPPPLI
jgi:hypothetical protein